MAFTNKGLYTITSDSGAKFSFTLFEGITSDNGSSLGGNSIQCSLVAYSTGYSLKSMNAMSFNNNAVTLKKRDGSYVDAQLIDSGGTLNWGGNLSTDNGYDYCCPLAVFHYTDNDSWGLSGGSFQYIKRTSEIPPADTPKWTGVGIAIPSDGNAGYFTATAENGVNSDNTGFITAQNRPQIYALLSGAEPFATDPYAPGGESDTGGGGGDFDPTSDPINIPGLPTVSAVDTGFITLYNPTLAELRNLAAYMWSSGFDISTLKKMFADPMDCILGLSLIPVDVPAGSSQNVGVGNIDTGVSMTLAASQYVAVDCGTINVSEYWGAYLDYAPFTKVELYLPYIGAHPLSADDVMGKTVHVVYHIDILSGACTAFVKCGDSVLYQFIGQCSASIPISGNDWTNVINGVLSIAGAIGTMVATGGAAAPVAMGAVASTAANGSLKPDVEKSGSVSGTGGILAIQKPYLTITRPRQALPKNQNSILGYPSFVTLTLGDISGYTVVDDIHLEGVLATDSEITEIVALLRNGVIL